MTTTLTLDQLTACGAHRTGHFLLSSGLHSADYLQCALFLSDTSRAERVGQLLAAALRGLDETPEVVVAPALGGLIIGHETARALGVPFLFTERSQGVMTLRRGFAVEAGQRVVVVEDVVTTGRSSQESIKGIEEGGARVIAMAAMVNRSGRSNPFEPLPFRALIEASFATWASDECPLCRQGQPFDKPGSRPGA